MLLALVSIECQINKSRPFLSLALAMISPLSGKSWRCRAPVRPAEPRGSSKIWPRRQAFAIRIKSENSALMHLKSYEIDGSMLHTGSANFSASGFKRQDNDLIVIKDAQAAAKFNHTFDMRFASGKTLSFAKSN